MCSLETSVDHRWVKLPGELVAAIEYCSFRLHTCFSDDNLEMDVSVLITSDVQLFIISIAPLGNLQLIREFRFFSKALYETEIIMILTLSKFPAIAFQGIILQINGGRKKMQQSTILRWWKLSFRTKWLF